jgi:hypothetical protein
VASPSKCRPTVPKLFQRRPSAPLLISLLALFVALGGPAQAAKLVRSKDVKNHTLKVRDLSKKAVKELKKTPRASIGERALANRAVTNAKLRDGAVTATKIGPAAVGSSQLAPNSVGLREIQNGSVATTLLADGAVNGAKVADGSLDVRDLARFYGRFSVVIPPVGPHKCWSGEPRDLAPELAGADIALDLVIVTPGKEWPQDQLAFTRRNSANASRFVLAGCNATDNWALPVTGSATGTEVSFRYAVIDLP